MMGNNKLVMPIFDWVCTYKYKTNCTTIGSVLAIIEKLTWIICRTLDKSTLPALIVKTTIGNTGSSGRLSRLWCWHQWWERWKWAAGCGSCSRFRGKVFASSFKILFKCSEDHLLVEVDNFYSKQSHCYFPINSIIIFKTKVGSWLWQLLLIPWESFAPSFRIWRFSPILSIIAGRVLKTTCIGWQLSLKAIALLLSYNFNNHLR